jgi:AraC family transcriptional regulator, exoenzyme S synthesis regulatory protein ExsA
MDFQTRYITPDIKLSCYGDKLFTTEVLFDDHMLVWFISGETRIIQSEAEYLFRAGDIFLIPRNQPATVINYPKDGMQHKTVVMHLSTDRLRRFYAGLDIKTGSRAGQKIRSFANHPLLQSCLASLIPYFDLQEKFPEQIASIKITEAISILRTIAPDIDQLLANFSEPGKIDLAGFMEENFMFNMPLHRFGYLTGRSLSTFNRDFKKLFNDTPEKWLMKKRLVLAHYQIAEMKKRPVDVYLEVGFEDLSHFSYAFKKQFGYTATSLPLRSGQQ